MGEALDAHERFKSYLDAVNRVHARPTCAIHRHFWDALPDGSFHTSDDIEFTILECISETHTLASLLTSIRRRKENIWIDRLSAQLNTKVNWRTSFSGHAGTKRSATALDGSSLLDPL